jgi:hypothetical protein
MKGTEEESMTEQKWLRQKDFYGMIELMHGQGRMRKLRLFAVACCCRITLLLSVKRAMTAVDLAERFAEGLVSEQEMIEAGAAAWQATRWTRRDVQMANVAASGTASSFEIPDRLYRAVNAATRMEGPYAPQRAAQQQLFNDIFGNPYRPAAVDPVSLTHDVLAIAHAAYDERIMPSGELDRSRLAVLSDALEEAGCDNATILDHLRGPGPHVRGCWALDLILGKS